MINIKEERKASKTTLRVFSIVTSVGVKAIGEIERENKTITDMSFETFYRLMKGLGKDPMQVLKEEMKNVD